VDSEHFWDTVAEDAVFEYHYHFPGFTTRIKGREAYMNWFSGYEIELQSAGGSPSGQEQEVRARPVGD
jgi:hypothetical protein